MFLFSCSPLQTPKLGDFAPPLELQSQEEKIFKLSDRKGHWTVLYFYPKDSTPGCTKQACTFQNSVFEIRRLGAEIYGISKDTVQSHKKFAARYGLQFPLLADPKGEAIKRYGVNGFFGFARRVTFIIDPELKVASIMVRVNPSKNPGDVVFKLKSLQAA